MNNQLNMCDNCKKLSNILLEEWDFDKNIGLNPYTISLGSNKKVFWKCSKCGGKWQASLYDRTRNNSTGCPYCAHQKVLAGYNDLATKYPEILKQWHPTKNILKPTEVMPGTSKKAWWLCHNGHEYEQAINARVLHQNSCPICSGQRVSIGENDLQSRYPDVAKEWLQNKNGTITPTTITWGSNKKFWWKCSKCGYEWAARVSDRTRDHNGCPVCANKILVRGTNDLATKFPKIAKEWHPKLNDFSPNDIIAVSLKKVWWLCPNGHEFKQSIYQRTTQGHNCPICCNNKLLTGYNDLATNFPEIAKEWHPTKNGNLKPKDVKACSKNNVWWICPNGHEFKQSISKRTSRNQSCPYCSNHKALKGFNDFESKYPDIAKEWHPQKNGGLRPFDVTYGSGKKVWWICPIGHEYQAIVKDRGQRQSKCPICNSRNSTSFGEQTIFFYIKKCFPDALNKYNDLFITSMEFDIYIPTKKIAIEYDGAHWHRTYEEHTREIKKYNFCKENNIFLYRVKEVNDNNWNDVANKTYYIPITKRNNFLALERIIRTIINEIDSSIVVNINIAQDKNEIQEYLSNIDNSLADVRPDVALKWNYEKNGILTPNMFSIGSSEIVWWKCPDCGKEWKTSISHMTKPNTLGCPECSRIQRGKSFTKLRVKQRGSLAENMPELAKEWNPTKNGNLTPYDITTGRFKPVWWKCSKCGYEWMASPNNRKKGISCPKCGIKKLHKAVEMIDLKTNEVIKSFPSITEASKALNCTSSHISDVCKGKRKSACGFKWRYKE